MNLSRRLVLRAALLALALFAAGCGSSSKSSTPPSTSSRAATATGAAKATSPTTTAGQSSSANALQAEVQATAAGDIPDNQVFLSFRNAGAGYAIKFPEGWVQRGNGASVSFQDKNNRI